jgi:hypothetical protein
MPAEPIPIVVSEEAAAYVASLGAEREFEQMIAWVKQNAPRLLHIRVETRCGAPRGVIIWAHRTPAADPAECIELDWGTWVVKTFGREIHRKILLISRDVNPAEAA